MSVHAPRNNLIAGNDSGFPASIIKLQPFTLFCLFALLFISRPLFSNLEPMESYEGPFFNFPIRLDDQLCSPAGLEHADQYPAHQLSYQDGMSDFNLCVDAGQSSVAKGTIDTYSVFGVEFQQSGIKNPSDGTRDMIKFSWPDRVEYISSPIMGQFQYPHAITVGDFHALLDSGLFVSGDNFMQGPVDLEADILQQSLAPQFMQLNTEVAPLQRFDVVEELHPVTPEIVSANASRKSSRNNNETNGCKHCNCKRSKCLKLYCECFSAGFYCTERCSCAGCLNRPEYEDTVLDFRKQIELRNPHAFAPKVVKQGNGSPANTMQEELYQTPPFWERHKRGCNCKKSNCAKNYCECYQANVGCSEGCRCENCENPFVPITIARVKHRQPVNQENQSPEPRDVLKTRNKYAWIERPNQSPEPLEVLKARDKYTRIERLNQSPPKREPLSDKSNVATISHPRLGLLALAPRATLH